MHFTSNQRGLINTMINTNSLPEPQVGSGVLFLSNGDAEDMLAALARITASVVPQEVADLRASALKAGAHWLARSFDHAGRLGRAGFSKQELETEFDGDPRWPSPQRPATAATGRASRAIDEAFRLGARAACAVAVERWLDDEGYQPGDFIYHAAGACISGARAADVDADTLREVITEAAAGRGVGVETHGHLEYECWEACAQDWERPSFQPESPPPPNPASAPASALFEGWRA
jgi:hypothetical protein